MAAPLLHPLKNSSTHSCFARVYRNNQYVEDVAFKENLEYIFEFRKCNGKSILIVAIAYIHLGVNEILIVVLMIRYSVARNLISAT